MYTHSSQKGQLCLHTFAFLGLVMFESALAYCFDFSGGRGGGGIPHPRSKATRETARDRVP